MIRKLVVCAGLLNATMAWAAAPGFLLGVDYSEEYGFMGQSATAMATDGSSAVYLLGAVPDTSLLHPTAALGPAGGAGSFVAKLSPNGITTEYLTVLGFEAVAMAVDSSGNVYIAGQNSVYKMNPTGTAWIYQMTIGSSVVLTGVAADQAGHAYVLGSTTTPIQTTAGAFQTTLPNGNSHAFVVRLNTAGTAFDYATYVTGSGNDYPSNIAVDGTGAAIISGTTESIDFPTTPGAYIGASVVSNSGIVFLTRLAPAGSSLIYSVLPGNTPEPVPMAADAAGDIAVSYSSVGHFELMRFDPTGALVFSSPVPGFGAMAMDASGDTYLTGATFYAGAVRNSLFPCGPDPAGYFNSPGFLTVFDPTGNVLQSTYLPVGAGGDLVATAANSAVFVMAGTDQTFVPTRNLVGMSSPYSALIHFVQNPAATVVQLACAGNAAGFHIGPIAAGEILSLFGQGLGPAEGATAQVTQDAFPKQVSGVEVTFNGVASPLVYVQDGQINAIVPWSLASASSAQVCVVYNGAATNCLTWPVAEAAPGVFTVDGYHAAALNQDGTINSASNPAALDSVVSVFASGLGPTDPAENDGAIVLPPWPTNTLQFGAYGRVGGILFSYDPLTTEYSGPAPYLVAGASQVNFMVNGSDAFVLQNPVFTSAEFGVYIAGQ